jgi:hypothetical protein
MKVASKIVFGLGLFTFVAAAIYGGTAHERTGAVLLLIVSIALFYIGLVAKGAAREAEDLEPEQQVSALQEQPEEEEEIGPTIWPFAFSLAAVGIVLGMVVARWLLVVGVVVFAASVVGWFRDIRRQHTPPDGGHVTAPR